MQLEAVKPAEGTFAALCYPFELYYNGFLQFGEPIVENGLRKQMTVSDTNLIQVRVSETLMV